MFSEIFNIRKWWLPYVQLQLIAQKMCFLTLVLLIYTGVTYTANEAYDIANRGKTFLYGGDGTFDDKEQSKVVYEVVSDAYWTLQWSEQASA